MYIFGIWIAQWLIGYWVCVNSCANAYYTDPRSQKEWGASNFSTVKNYGLIWNLIPILGFMATYSFITENERIMWEKMTFRYIKQAWE